MPERDDVVLGIDPSLTATGWAIAHRGRVLDAGACTPGGRWPIARTWRMMDDLTAWAEEQRDAVGADACLLVIERTPTHYGAKGRRGRGAAQGDPRIIVRAVSELAGAIHHATWRRAGWQYPWTPEPDEWRRWWSPRTGTRDRWKRFAIQTATTLDRTRAELYASSDDAAEAALIAAGASTRLHLAPAGPTRTTGPVARSSRRRP